MLALTQSGVMAPAAFGPESYIHCSLVRSLLCSCSTAPARYPKERNCCADAVDAMDLVLRDLTHE
eukprot:297726-Pyramimonas_sp.AAC.1